LQEGKVTILLEARKWRVKGREENLKIPQVEPMGGQKPERRERFSGRSVSAA